MKNEYQKRKENGMCVKCGKDAPVEGKTLCAACAKRQNTYQNEMRQFRKSFGICPRCGVNRLFGDEKVCPECNAKAYENSVKNRAKIGKDHYNRTHAEWAKKEHYRRIEQGICTRCGKRMTDNGYKTCGICRSKNKNYKRLKYGKPDRAERQQKGLCYFCENPIKIGYKVCEKHYRMNLANLQHPNCQIAKEEIKRQNNNFFEK